MIYKNTKAMVWSQTSSTFSLQGDILAAYLFLLYQDYVLQTFIELIKENGFPLKSQEANDIPQQHRMYWIWYQHTPSKGVECYWLAIDHTEI